MPIGLTEMYFRAQMPRLFEAISRPSSQRPPKQTDGSASYEALAGFVYGCSCEQADRGARFVGRRVPDADEPHPRLEALTAAGGLRVEGYWKYLFRGLDSGVPPSVVF